MGLPMIIPAMYLMILALGPIVFIEAFMLRSLNLSLERSIISSALANIVSTAVGIPVTWMLLFCLETATGGMNFWPRGSFWDIFFGITVRSPWMYPRPPEYDWMTFAAGVFLLVPFFFATWLVEYFVVRIMARAAMTVKGVPAEELDPKIKRAVRNANLVSYALLALVILVMLAVKLLRTG